MKEPGNSAKDPQNHFDDRGDIAVDRVLRGADRRRSSPEFRYGTCFRATQLRFLSASTDLLGLVLLQCEDVSSLGWEGIRYRVQDIEEEFVSFFCCDIAEVVVAHD